MSLPWLPMRIAILVCVITMPQTSFAQKPYRGAELRTIQSYTYGRFEVRMKSAFGSGMLCSFFTYHDENPNAHWNEIDIEILGRYTNEVQFNTITPGVVNHVFRHMAKFNPHQAFHVYAIEWTPDYVAWQVDGYEVHRQTEPHIQTLQYAQKIMMNIWQPIYEDWVGVFNPDTLPFYAYYDWVKCYQYTPGVNDNFTLEWTDDFDSWNQLRWDKGTHTWDGNNCQFIPENAVFQDGYMILCLTTPEAVGYSGAPIVDEDVDAPYLVWAHAFDDRVQVYFSEEIEQASAETVSNYIIPGITVKSAALLADNKSVELATDSLDLSVSYPIIVNKIKDRANPPHTMSLQNRLIANALPLPIKINVGGESAAEFRADQVWNAGLEYGAVGGTSTILPAGSVSGAETGEQGVFDSLREGVNFYNVRVPPGVYNLTFLLAEFEFEQSGQRVFDLFAENQLLAENVDVVARAGKRAALKLNFEKVAVSDGVLNLYFKSKAGQTILNGLQIVKVLPTGIGQTPAIPENFKLDIYPNPFNPSATVAYRLSAAGHIKLDVLNIAGQRVDTLVDEFQPVGDYSLPLHLSRFSSGLYFVNLILDGRLQRVKKAILLR